MFSVNSMLLYDCAQQILIIVYSPRTKLVQNETEKEREIILKNFNFSSIVQRCMIHSILDSTRLGQKIAFGIFLSPPWSQSTRVKVIIHAEHRLQITNDRNLSSYFSTISAPHRHRCSRLSLFQSPYLSMRQENIPHRTHTLEKKE